MGWDDNGLPPSGACRTTSACAATRPSPTTRTSSRRPKPDARTGGVLAGPTSSTCATELTAEDEEVFEDSVRRLGRRSTGAALHHHRRPGPAYQPAHVPAQPGARRGLRQRGAHPLGRRLPHRGRPGRAGGPRDPGRTTTASPRRPTAAASVEIHTTRAELPACVALVAHPDDERYQPLFGTTVVTPLFHVEVPIVAHELADPDKGSGIAMVCTFGDTTDVTWWRELHLPTCASSVATDASLPRTRPSGSTPATPGPGPLRRADRQDINQAQARIVELLREPAN